MLAHSDLTVLITLSTAILTLGENNEVIKKIPLAPNEAAFIESKDVLLQMLEKKLKEIKEHKKLKNGNGDVLPKNVDFKLKSNGISGVGEAELLLKYGPNGQGMANLSAEGISNVGKVQLLIGTGENGLRIPGLGNLFSGSSIRSGNLNDEEQLKLVNQNDINMEFRRQANELSSNNSANKVNAADAGPATEAVKDNKSKLTILKAKPEEKVAEETVSTTETNKNDNANSAAATSDYVPTMSKVTGGNAASSNGQVFNPDLPIKSDTTFGNVANNGEIINKVE